MIAERAAPLSVGHFRRIAENGFGDGNNSYPFGSVWHDGHLYIGTNRNALPILILRSPFKLPFIHPPVPTPKPEEWQKLDNRAQIWRYSPELDSWERVYISPLNLGHKGLMAPQAVGFRCMTVFQGRNDNRASIYTIPVVGRNALGTTVLRCEDGKNFESLGPPRINGKDDVFAAYRAIIGFNGYLFAAPTSAKAPPEANAKNQTFVSFFNTAEGSAVRCSADPLSGTWEFSSDVAFGDRSNISITDMAVCGDFLYAGTLNAHQGFQLWRTKAEGPPPHHWEKVLDHGADRGPLNEGVLSMAEFKGNLYVGTCIQNGGYDRGYNIGPAAAEVIRVHPDRTWDLVMGAARNTRQGLKIPTSGLGPGFENRFGVYMWRMCTQQGALYVGTHDLSSFVPFTDPATWPARARKIFDQAFLETFMELKGGAELWRTVDGDDWTPVTVNGFGNFYNFGFRALVSSPKGLFVGAANPFGPEVAVKHPDGWRHEINPRGGIEVWLGSYANGGKDDRDGREGSVRDTETPLIINAPAQPLTGVRDGLGLISDFEAVSHSLMSEASTFRNDCRFDPILRMTLIDPDLEPEEPTLDDELAVYFGGPDIRCVGYWRNDRTTPAAAGKALVKKMLEFLEPDSSSSELDLLVIGNCAPGLVPELRKVLPASKIRIMAENKSVYQRIQQRLDNLVTKTLRRGGRFPWENQSFDLVIWLEGPSLTDRAVSLTEACRVLRPGGRLIATDLIGEDARQSALLSVPGSSAARIREYERLLTESGFDPVSVFDLTENSWNRFVRHSRQYALTKSSFQLMSQDRQVAFLDSLPGGRLAVELYVMLVATRKSEVKI
ncbi:MAG: class I SAM-dependent methyltransferase [Methylococcales bacterium]